MENVRREVVWSLTAQRDLIDIWGYFANVASAAPADRLVDEIEAAANRLVFDPRMHRVRRDLIPDFPGELRSIPAHPYTVFYRMNPRSADGHEEIEILRVLHERRDFSSELPNTSYTASSLRTMVRALGRLLPTPELVWSRGHETTVSKLGAV